MRFLDQYPKIESFIIESKLDEALEQSINIVQYDDPEAYNQLVLLKARYSKVQREINSGIVNNDYAQLELNRIQNSLVQVLGDIEIDTNKMVVSEIRNLITNGEAGKSVRALSDLYKEKYADDRLGLSTEIVVLESHYRKLEEDVMKGIISQDESNKQYNQIFLAILALLEKIDKDGNAIIKSSKQASESYQLPTQAQKIYNDEISTGQETVDELTEILSKEVIDLYAEIDQVKVVFGDVFTADVGLIVLPRNNMGDISPSVEEGMSRIGYKYRSRKKALGMIEVLPKSRRSKIEGRVALAVSVDVGKESSIQVIVDIGAKIGEMTFGDDAYKSIAVPLLGTGAGMLNKKSAFYGLEEGFKSTCASDAKLYVYILDKEIFDVLIKAKRDQLFDIVIEKYFRFDSDSVDGDDQLGIEHEVNSFANLITSSNLNPPLSIGLFGNWGTGKSFFIEKLSERVDEISKENKGISGVPICQDVVQIKFNAWYYVDANLWASLVSSIFDEISKYLKIETKEEQQQRELYENLASTQEQVRLAELEADRYNAEVETLNGEIIRLKEARQKKREKLEDVKLEHILKEAQKDETVSAFVKKAQEMLGFSEMKQIGLRAERTVEDIEGLISRYQSTQGKVVQVYRYIMSLKSWKTLSVLLFLSIIPLGAYFFLYENPLQWKVLGDSIFSFIGTIGTIIASLSLFIRKIINEADPILQKVNAGVQYLNQAKYRLQNLQDIASREADEQILILEHEYEQLNEEHQKAIAQKWEVEKKLKLIKGEVDKIKAGKRIKGFIQKRIENDDYQKHLGIISIVRKDFLQLSQYLKEHKTIEALSEAVHKIEETDRIDRIILYIDDLDRCPPEKVVDVLQAIHLILAFPLFVVVVGVDVRWVSKSLIKKYGKMLTHYDSDLPDDPELRMELQGSATPYDYLEKIFQIPFKLKSLSDKDKEVYITNLLAKDLAVDQNDREIVNEREIATEQNSSNDEKRSKELETTEQEVASVKTHTTELENIMENNVQTVPPKIVKPVEDTVPKKQDEIKRWDTVKLTKEEFDFIIGLAPVTGNTARTIKRYVNLARLIKSNNNWIPENYDVINTKPYNACLFMLAIVVGAPWMFPLFFSLIKEEANEAEDKRAKTLGQLVKKKQLQIGEEIDKHGHINKEWDNLGAFLAQIESHENVDIRAINSYDLSYLQQITPIVSRFSFRVLEEVEASNFLKKLENEST